MSDKIDALIKDIAVKHSIAISRDDPILMMQTIHDHLMQDSAKAQQMMLMEFKQELEDIAQRWQLAAQEKSDRILNASLKASKEILQNHIQENAKNNAQIVRQAIQEAFDEATRKISHATYLCDWLESVKKIV